jgi:PIN domain nuclease of toxin-antitoxin system
VHVLLDTHALIWLDQDLSALGVKARQSADSALHAGGLAVSAISFWEVAMQCAKGRLSMALPTAVWRRDLLGQGLVEIPVDGEIGVMAAQLDLHGDPVDRIIAATAVLKGATLITADEALLRWAGDLARQDARR